MKAGYHQNHSEDLSKGIGMKRGGHEAVQSTYLKLGVWGGDLQWAILYRQVNRQRSAMNSPTFAMHKYIACPNLFF